MKLINLLPIQEQRELKLRFLASQLLGFWTWIVGGLIIFFVLGLLTQFYLDRIISETESKIAENRALLESSDYKDLETQILLLNRNIKEINNLESQHYYWSDALVQLSNLIPGDMQLNTIIFDRATSQIQITGQAATRESVIAFWSNVIKSEYFKNINFPLTNLEQAVNPDFTYSFYLRPEKFSAKGGSASGGKAQP